MDYLWMMKLASEFFWGEAIYGMEDSLRKLRKWRLVMMCIPVSGLIVVAFSALHGAEAMARDRIRDLGISNDMPMSRVEYSVERSVSVLTQLQGATVDMRVELAVMGAKMDLLMGAIGIILLSQIFAFFYQVRLRRTLRGIEN